MLTKIFGEWMDCSKITHLEERQLGAKNTHAYGVKVYFENNEYIFIQGKNSDEVAEEINKYNGNLSATNSEVDILEHTFGDVSAALSSLCIQSKV